MPDTHPNSFSTHSHNRSFFGFLREPELALVALLVVVVPCIVVPSNDKDWHGLKSVIVDLIGIIVLGIGLVKTSASKINQLITSARGTPLFWFVILAAWSTLSLVWSASLKLSCMSLIALISGLSIACSMAVRQRKDQSILYITRAVIFSAMIISLAGLLGLGLDGTDFASFSDSGQWATGTSLDHGLFGSLCMILLPMVISIGIAPIEPIYRYTAQGTALCTGIALFVSQDRSGWLGAIVSLAVFGLLYYQFCMKVRIKKAGHRRHKDLHQAWIIPYILLAVGCIAGLVMMLPDLSSLNTRLETLDHTAISGDDSSFDWRVQVWRSDLKMIAARPILGTGIGTYPVIQHAYTSIGAPPSIIYQRGPTLLDEAHNSYLQYAVELGLPGLTIYVIALVSTLVYGYRSLKLLQPSSLRQLLVIGCISAIAGHAVDATANPSWQFADVTLYLWVPIGLMTAASYAGPERKRLDGEPDEPDNRVKRSRGSYLTRLALVALGVGSLIYFIVENARLLPAPRL